MMNLSSGRDHNIYGLPLTGRRRELLGWRRSDERHEGGYTLVALLTVMSVLALFALAAAPSVQQQVRREREKEAIFRGEQVADAIRDYYLYKQAATNVVGDQSLPTSVDQLLEGVPVRGGSKKQQILRPSAARDPLSSSGEWGLIRPRSGALIDFQRAVTRYAGNVAPTPLNPQLAQLQQFSAPPILNINDLAADQNEPGNTESAEESSGPFIGVSSRSKSSSVLYYYGIDHHNQWIFTPLFRR